MGIQQIPLAAGGVTLAEVNTAIQTNTPTWTQLGTQNQATNVSNYSFTGLSSYKRFKLNLSGVQNFASYAGGIFLRFNNDTSNQYSFKYQMDSTQNHWIFNNNNHLANGITIGSFAASAYFYSDLLIENPLNGKKWLDFHSMNSTDNYHAAGSVSITNGSAFYNSTTTISSIQIELNGSGSTSGIFTLWGQL